MSRPVHFVTFSYLFAGICKYCKTTGCGDLPTLARMQPEASPPDPAAVQRAVQMAVHLPAGEAGRLRVQVVDRHGHLLASAILQSLEQADFLKDMLRHVGAFDMVPPALAGERGCDVLLQEAYVSRTAQQPADLVRAQPGRKWSSHGTWRGEIPPMQFPRTVTA